MNTICQQSLQERLLAERQFHDEQAQERAATFAAAPERLKFADAEYLDHESWIRPAWAELGPLRGRQVLDLGCGHGMASVVLARAGAMVTGVDLSEGYVIEARRRAAANGVQATFHVADGHALPFPAQHFDAIWGHAILHHFQLDRAAAELRRVLKPRGVAVFCEPWGGNPVLELARRYIPYPGKHRTADETPLRRTDLRILREYFPSLSWQGHQLTCMVRRFWRKHPGQRLLHDLDRALLGVAPGLKNWCRYVVIVLRSV